MSLLKLVGLAFVLIGLAGCSTLSDVYNGDDDYRVQEAQLAKKLEMPPNFVERNNSSPVLTQQVVSADLSEVETIPSYQLDGLTVKSNLVERWLEFDGIDAKQVWTGLQQFIQKQGFKVDEERLDIGLITTQYLARSEQAPVEQELGKISRMLNSWRPELVSGIYDRFSIQLIEDSETDKVKVTFRHHMMLADSSANATDWVLRPYDPMMESIALYQAMIFFGATQLQAIEAIETAVYYQENLDGEELAGLVLAASRSQSWDYLQSMIYRGDWQVKSTKPTVYEVWVVAPKSSISSKGFFARLFSRDAGPDLVRLKLSQHDANPDQTLLSLAVEEGQRPLTPEQRRKILTALGLLEK